MSKPWDGLVVGGDMLSDTYFGGGYESDFTQPLNGRLNANGIIGTTNGYEGDPFNFTYPTDGQFKLGRHLQCHQTYATGYNYPNASDQTNKETIHYDHPHGDNPNPLELFSTADGKLTMKTKPVDSASNDWARVKGYAQNDAGNEATYGFLRNEGGWPSHWAPSISDPPDGALAHFLNMEADFRCPMISTYNRRSMSFGRSGCRVKVPVGARATGSTADYRNIDTWFPAIWDLEDVPARCDINGVWHDKDTYTPGNIGAGNNLNELDQGEFFGYSNDEMHITSHHYSETASGYLTNTPTADGSVVQVRRTRAVQANHTGGSRVDQAQALYPDIGTIRGNFIEVGVDRFPAGGATYPNGLICYWANGKVVALYHMPAYMAQPKIIYEPLATIPYLPYLDSSYNVKRLGVQAYENGQPAYMHWCQIFNIAANAGFTRSQAAFYLDHSATVPSFSEEEEMVLDWVIMKPLIDENPDSRAFIDYSAGDFGGSGSAPYVVTPDPDEPDEPVDPEDPDPDPAPDPDEPDVVLPPISQEVGDPIKPKPPEGSHYHFVEHDWFTLMRGIEPDIMVKEKPGFIFSNGVEKTMPLDVQRKTVADEDN